MRRRAVLHLGFAAGLLAVALAPGAREARGLELRLTTVTHPSWVDRLPGADGLVGTADDPTLAGANPEGSASAIELGGGAIGSYRASLVGDWRIASAFLPGGRVVRTQTPKLTVPFRPNRTIAFRRTGTDFDVRFTGSSVGVPDTRLDDLPYDPTSSIPHWVDTPFLGIQQLRTTLWLCAEGAPCSEVDPRVAVRGEGVFLLRQFIDRLDASTRIGRYLESILTKLPDGWTAVSVLELSLDAPEFFPPESDAESVAGAWVFVSTDEIFPRDIETFYATWPDLASLRGQGDGIVDTVGDLRAAGEPLVSAFSPIGDSLGTVRLTARTGDDLRTTPGDATLATPRGTIRAVAMRANEVRRVDAASGRPLDGDAPQDARCLRGTEASCLGPEWLEPGSRAGFDEVCGVAQAFLPSLVCGVQRAFGAVFEPSVLQQAVNRLLTGEAGGNLILVALANPDFLPSFGIAQSTEVLISLATPSPPDPTVPPGSLREVLSAEQRQLLGCGPAFGRDCFVDGPDLFATEAGGFVESWPGPSGDTFDVATPQPGTLGSPRGDGCARYQDGSVWVLPGCRGESDPGYDPEIDGSGSGGEPHRHPYSGQRFRTEMAAVSWNALAALSAVPNVGRPIPVPELAFDATIPFRDDGCSLRRPGLCLQPAAGVGSFVVRELPDDPSGVPRTRWLWETGAEYRIEEATGEFERFAGGFLHVFGPVESAVPGTVAGAPILIVPPRDRDLDGALDRFDVCPDVADDQADADGDGNGDACDNCRLVANGERVRGPGLRVQHDADEDGFGNACDADFNQDGYVGGPDFDTFLRCLFRFVDTPSVEPGGPPEDPTCAEADMTGDGYVGGPDFDLFLRYYDSGVDPPAACGLGFELGLLAVWGAVARRRGRSGCVRPPAAAPAPRR